MRTEQLYSEQTSQQFYDERYAKGYMDEWPLEKKQRVFEILKGLDLPERGEALDFGCGNGVFTEVLWQALPGWKIYGTDISPVAIDHAAERVPGCVFFDQSNEALTGKKFDFLFTHHVLEHVYNLQDIWRQVVGFMKPRSAMFHILPCGNEGSFEHKICALRTDGINAAMENRFFYEDTGHVRRVTTGQFIAMAGEDGFCLAEEYYSNQRDGAVDWITQNDPAFVLMLTDPSKARDEGAKRELSALRRRLLVASVLRDLRARVKGFRGRKKNAKAWVGLLAGLPLYPFSTLLDRSLRRKAQAEWERKKRERGGSEMYLYFKR